MIGTMTIHVPVTIAPIATIAMVGRLTSAALCVNGMVLPTAKTVILGIFRRAKDGN